MKQRSMERMLTENVMKVFQPKIKGKLSRQWSQTN